MGRAWILSDKTAIPGHYMAGIASNPGWALLGRTGWLVCVQLSTGTKRSAIVEFVDLPGNVFTYEVTSSYIIENC